MKMIKKKGILSLALALAVVFCFIPNINAKADDAVEITSIALSLTEPKVGETAQDMTVEPSTKYYVDMIGDEGNGHKDWIRGYVLGWSDSSGAHFEGTFKDGEKYTYTFRINGLQEYDDESGTSTKYTVSSNTVVTVNGKTPVCKEIYHLVEESDYGTYEEDYGYYTVTYSFAAEEEESTEATTEATTEAANDETKTTYTIVEGANQNITAQAGKDLVIKASGDLSKFTDLKIDGTVVDKANYETAQGSTIAIIKESFVDTLAAGSHTVTFVYT
ncbi:MAG: hypothetical protein IJ053_02155, partial [Lachnospiraceae bacterium]|nr:hypothetical protein [Lachnospiraceae bacterium]